MWVGEGQGFSSKHQAKISSRLGNAYHEVVDVVRVDADDQGAVAVGG